MELCSTLNYPLLHAATLIWKEHADMAEKNYPIGYGRIQPVSDYRPWDVDEEFRRVSEPLRSYTMVDDMRMYELWTLSAEALKRDGDLLEVGVWRGGSGALLAARAQAAGRRTWLADTFQGVVKAGPKDEYYKGGEHANTTMDFVREALATLDDASDVEILEGIFPDDTGDQVRSAQFCFVHVDVDVYQSALDVFEWAWPRMSVGGMVVFDDYGFYGCEGVTRCVDELRDGGDRVFFHNLNGHAVLLKL